ncbi:calreticulin [Tieghemostelium lacteum]|uniref:Calreticulin n=1 Tax=Tieghemostelium lacteum TaxID=361077 RepID=A0A151ZC81_TIELA|nr:calreticulin [Tieghemostelium lacteum]|eukprot:KYQ91548.1 calreticulin [Tieghemostelium lacteum]
MKLLNLTLLIVAIVGVASATIHFQENFDNDWENRWVTSDWKVKEGQSGKFVHTAGKWYGSESNKGIQTSQDARFYAVSAKFPEFSNEGKDLVLQYTVKQENKVDCGGSYIKLLPAGLDQENFGGDSEYSIMFGPDQCGTQKRVHVILNYKGKNHLIKKEISKVETDQLTHQYTLIIHPDNTYAVLVDNNEVQTGSLFEDWDILPAKQIKDPKQSKPVDWVDVKEIDDPEDIKPADYDSIPATVVDPEAVKPEDWNDEDDGEWEAPTIANPDFKGEWKAKKIANPAYKGEWVHPMIDNPEYKEDASVYVFPKLSYVGFELWQVKSGSIFDHIIVTDSVEEAKEFSEKNFVANQESEKKMFDEQEEKRVAEEKKKAEEAKAAQAEEAGDIEDDEELVHETKKDSKPSKPSKKTEGHDEL